jgi:hypothetical protein
LVLNAPLEGKWEIDNPSIMPPGPGYPEHRTVKAGEGDRGNQGQRTRAASKKTLKKGGRKKPTGRGRRAARR